MSNEVSSETSLRTNGYVSIDNTYIYFTAVIEGLQDYVNAAQPGTISDFDANRLLNMSQHIKSDNKELAERREKSRAYDEEQRRLAVLAADRPEEPR